MQPQLGVGIGLDHERLAPGRGPRSVDRAENGHWSERGQFLLVPDYGRETVHDHGETERAEKACDGGQQDDQLPRRTDPFAGGGRARRFAALPPAVPGRPPPSSTRRARRRQRLQSGRHECCRHLERGSRAGA